MVWAILAALGSSILRASLNVIDRTAFGHRGAAVIAVNLVNNLLPLVIILPVSALVSGPGRTMEALGDIRNLWVAGLVQLVAYAFSFAFKGLTISQVIVFSKLPDVFILIGIYALTLAWSWADFAFAALTTLVCLPLLVGRGHTSQTRNGRWWAPGMLMGAVLVRGVFSGSLIQTQGEYHDVWLPITAATLWWRFVWSLVVLMGSAAVSRRVVWASPGVPLLIGRAVVTLGVQALYVLALAIGPATAVWPIIDSTALFSTAFSAILLHEHPSRREVAAVLGIVILTLARMLYG